MPYGRSETEVLTAWEDLPLKHGEEGTTWHNLMAKYSHTGCPGLDYEDRCPSDTTFCAARGVCEILHNKQKKEWEAKLKEK